ncbi:hypothetical protein [Aestuariibaculum suncheonense]|uniref:STAS/SEC14 domain-containing protein n=1 Tax=Aestuariibaculum suncheonense TaxID=1028745 RepID=A0A8J6QG80_9FLAO|nr:hypothetical protein [Aestuariibaculum suncheonense]MBD0834996.1 hypothetical protein [Aestuariibaculum suncheonense]
MTFENLAYYDSKQFFKLEKPFGVFYFGEKFVLSELNEGVHFDWPMVENLINDIIAFYGSDAKLAYISNRIYSYSRDPHNWNKLSKYNIIVASAVVIYNDMAYMNATLEKRFSKESIKRCTSLSEAIEWVFDLKEFN